MLFVYFLIFVGICAFVNALRDQAWAGRLQDEGLPLNISLEIALHGAHEQIVRTLDELGGLLQPEADRSARVTEKLSARTGRKVDAGEFRSMIRQNCQRLAAAFKRAEDDFAMAFAPAGGPQKVQRAYARLVSALIRAEFSMAMVQAPLEQAHVELEFHYLLRSICDQLSAWPQQIRDAIPGVHDGSCNVMLRVSAETATLMRALLQPA